MNKDRETGPLAFDRRNSSNPREKEKNFWRDIDGWIEKLILYRYFKICLINCPIFVIV